MTVFKQLLDDYKQCLIRGDHMDAGAAYLAVAAEHADAQAEIARLRGALEKITRGPSDQFAFDTAQEALNP